jgi:hypothetical protein
MSHYALFSLPCYSSKGFQSLHLLSHLLHSDSVSPLHLLDLIRLLLPLLPKCQDQISSFHSSTLKLRGIGLSLISLLSSDTSLGVCPLLIVGIL